LLGRIPFWKRYVDSAVWKALYGEEGFNMVVVLSHYKPGNAFPLVAGYCRVVSSFSDRERGWMNDERCGVRTNVRARLPKAT
jgi:hypothetical protein